jgi:vitamin B12 transporter
MRFPLRVSWLCFQKKLSRFRSFGFCRFRFHGAAALFLSKKTGQPGVAVPLGSRRPQPFFTTFLLGVFVVLISAGSAGAQTQSATVSGSITDPGGAVIAGARITAAQLGGSAAGESQQASSSSDGRFVMKVAPGRYRITVARESFSSWSQEFTIAAGGTHELQVRLALEPLSAKVDVTAQVLPLDAESSPAPLTILTREQIDQRIAASLPDLLDTQPGFSLGRTGPEGGSTSLFLDGGNSNYTKVLIDGVPANQPGGLIDFSNFTVDNIDKIEVVRGAESALYGTDAMDGVIQIFTHRGTTRIPEFTAFADGGNFATGHGGAELSGLLGRFDYSAAVSDLETSGQGANDAFRNRSLSGLFGWRVSDVSRIQLSLRDNDSEAGTPGQTLLQPPNLTDTISQHDFTAGLHAEFVTGSRWHHQLNGIETYYREFNFDPSFPSFFQYNRAGFVGESTYLLRSAAFTAGYEYEVENGFVSFLGMHARRNNQAGFLDARWQPLGRLTLDAGARAEDNTYYGTRVVPRAGASYALRINRGTLGDTRLRGSYGQGIVEPRFDQSFGDDPCFPGNPLLSPEESRTIHAGVEQKLASDRVVVDADYFDNRYHNIISFISGPSTAACPFGMGTFFNTNLARARGASFSGEARIARWLSASANYTFDSTRTLSAPGNLDPNYFVGSRLIRRPVNSGNLALNAAFLRMNWNLSAYFTGQRLDGDFVNAVQVVNPGYALLNLAASYRITRGVSVYGRIDNLADRQYSEVYGYPALGREFRIGVKYTTRHE